jgi:hypothetical protein
MEDNTKNKNKPEMAPKNDDNGTHTMDKDTEAFRPRRSLARSPLQWRGSPRIDLNAAAIQIAPKSADGPARDGSGRFLPRERGGKRPITNTQLRELRVSLERVDTPRPTRRKTTVESSESVSDCSLETVKSRSRSNSGSSDHEGQRECAPVASSQLKELTASLECEDTPVSRRKTAAEGSGTVSDGSLETIKSRSRSNSGSSSPHGGKSRFWRDNGPKRICLELEVSEGEDPQRQSQTPTECKMQRDRPLTTGQYMGLVAAKRALIEAKREELLLDAEREMAKSIAQVQRTRSFRLSESSSASETTINTVQEMRRTVMDQVGIITKVATKSGHLQGTYVRALKNVAAAIPEVFDSLCARTVSEETKLLQAANKKLQEEVASLRQELAQIKNTLDRTKVIPAPSQKEVRAQPHRDEIFERSIMAQIGSMVNARFEALEKEERLLPAKTLRPLPASDGKASKVVLKNATPVQQPKPAEKEAVPGPAQATQKKKGKKKKTASQPAPEPTEPRPLPPAPETMNRKWTAVVGGRKQRRKAAAREAQAQAKSLPAATQVAKKLRPPRSVAIVLSILPEAEKNGITYKSVIEEAKKKVNLSELDIESVRFKVAATGARMLELPGATSASKADKLAEKLREVFSSEEVRVSRPTKCTEMRLSGLDDSVTATEVADAVARIGGCTVQEVKVGDIKSDPRGLGSVWLRCPVTAAKKVAERGRLLVGWVSAQVKVLEARPQRCYRCLETGHVYAKCTSEVDRSNLCYRCSQPGHKAKECSAEPNCCLCAAAGKTAGHRTGSKSCTAPRTKRSRTKAGNGPRAPAAEEATRMATD